VAAAVGSAVTEATGVVIRDLPLTPERIWRALHEARSGPGAARDRRAHEAHAAEEVRT
jgi:hypothetical protein